MSDKIKELFTIQYWGQKVYKPETVSDPMEVNSGDMGSGYLLLRSVGQLTDEECELVYIYSGVNLNPSKSTITRWLTGWEYQYQINYIVYQYLLRIGILLPITYLENNKPITIQPEEIIKRGWAKYQGICKH